MAAIQIIIGHSKCRPHIYGDLRFPHRLMSICLIMQIKLTINKQNSQSGKRSTSTIYEYFQLWIRITGHVVHIWRKVKHIIKHEMWSHFRHKFGFYLKPNLQDDGIFDWNFMTTVCNQNIQSWVKWVNFLISSWQQYAFRE